MEQRVTDFGVHEIQLLDGKTYKIRSLTFKEKREYLELVAKIKVNVNENSDLAKEYLNLQKEVAKFLLSKMNPEITDEVIENSVNGEILKKLIDIAFYDPFSVFKTA